MLIILFISACNQKQETVQEQWIKGNEQKKLETIENQFRGFDMAMVKPDIVIRNYIGLDKTKTGDMPIINWRKSKRQFKMAWKEGLNGHNPHSIF